MSRPIDEQRLLQYAHFSGNFPIAVTLLIVILLIGIVSAMIGANLARDAITQACDQAEGFTVLHADGDVSYRCVRKQFH